MQITCNTYFYMVFFFDSSTINYFVSFLSSAVSLSSKCIAYINVVIIMSMVEWVVSLQILLFAIIKSLKIFDMCDEFNFEIISFIHFKSQKKKNVWMMLWCCTAFTILNLIRDIIWTTTEHRWDFFHNT